MERDLKLRAEERSTTLQEKVNQDAMVIDRSIREHDEARREAEARRADLGVEVAYGWMSRKFLPVCTPISPRHGGFFRSKVMSMITYLPLSWRFVTTCRWRKRRGLVPS